MTKDEQRKIDVVIGQRIRQRRNEIGMSQERLGELLGVTFQQVQKYEKGTNRMGGSRLVDACQVLNVRPGFLLDDLSEQGAAFKSPPSVDPTISKLCAVASGLTDLQKRQLLQFARVFASPKIETANVG